MLYLIGTGLYYLNDLPFRAIEIIKQCDAIFLERYTNLNDISFFEKLEEISGRKIEILEREKIESDFIIEISAKENIALLVPGDPLAATTHFSLLYECREKRIPFRVLHASSIFSAVGETGLSIYKFGGTTSIPIFTENFHPESFFETIEKNIKCGYHTLVLLEVRDENNFVSPYDAEDILKKIEHKKDKNIIDWKNVLVLSRLGSESQIIKKLDNEQYTIKPPCALVIPGNLSKNEIEAIDIL